VISAADQDRLLRDASEAGLYILDTRSRICTQPIVVVRRAQFGPGVYLWPNGTATRCDLQAAPALCTERAVRELVGLPTGGAS
jgi:hypothetical protein